jgi:predicted 2-oxoglutarate/Fe(II)-dependent dioxygenase YbiX
MTPSQYFEKNRYVYLSNVVSRQTCEDLTNYMFRLFDEGKLTRDPQCPVSDSVYGDPVLDNLLNSLAGPLSAQLGMQLLPTYTYARIYRPGEILVRHRDREACEISGTMTLGFDPGSGIWPIYFTGDEDDVVGNSVEINVGDLVMYRGNELHHWRPSYKGKWQVQVFFHYVDANGPHASWANDKRNSLGIQRDAIVVEKPKPAEPVKTSVESTETAFGALQSKIITDGVIIRTSDDLFPGAVSYHSEFNPEFTFSPAECAKILDLQNMLYPIKSTVGDGDRAKYDPSIRAVDTYSIEYNEDTSWIFKKIAAAVGKANAEYYRYDLYGITHALQLLHYKATENGHYDWHIDCGNGNSATRKISLSIPLTDRSAYDGGELWINNNGSEIRAIDEQGSISFFPSYLLHQVTPVTRGERWVIVVWVNGPRFR